MSEESEDDITLDDFFPSRSYNRSVVKTMRKETNKRIQIERETKKRMSAMYRLYLFPDLNHFVFRRLTRIYCLTSEIEEQTNNAYRLHRLYYHIPEHPNSVVVWAKED